MAAADCTVNAALLLVSGAGQPFIITRYWFPFIAPVTAVRLSVADVAPAISVKLVPPLVLTCHWYVVAPVAVTLKDALLPAQAVTAVGCAVITVVVITFTIKQLDDTIEGVHTPDISTR